MRTSVFVGVHSAGKTARRHEGAIVSGILLHYRAGCVDGIVIRRLGEMQFVRRDADHWACSIHGISTHHISCTLGQYSIPNFLCALSISSCSRPPRR